MIQISIFNKYEKGQYHSSLILSNSRRNYSFISAIQPSGTFLRVREYYHDPEGKWYDNLKLKRIKEV